MDLPGLLDAGRRRSLMLVAALTLVQGAAAGAAAFATRGLFEAMHDGTPPPALLLGVLGGAGLCIAAARVGARRAGERLGQDYALAIRLALLDHAARMPSSAIARRRTGYMSLRFVGDMTAFRNWPGRGLPRLIAGAVMIPSACLVLWLLDPVFALAVVPVLGLALGLLAVAGPRLGPLHRRLRARRARIAADMAERLPIAPELDRLGRRSTELRSLRRRSLHMIRAGLARLTWAETLKALPDALAGIAAAAIVLAGAGAGTGSGAIAGALAALGLLLAPLRDLAGVWNLRSAYVAARGKCAAVLGRPQRALYAADARLPQGPVALRIAGLEAAPGESLSLDLPAGATHALACSPEAAEWLFCTLCGLENVDPGRIMFAGQCLTGLSRGSLRRSVQRLCAGPVMLRGSLRRNLALGLRTRPTDTRLERAARRAGLGALLDRTGGLDATLPEMGRGLSAAELSAISLARLLLARPGLVLIDGALWHLGDMGRTELRAHLARTGATVLLHPVLGRAGRRDAAPAHPLAG